MRSMKFTWKKVKMKHQKFASMILHKTLRLYCRWICQLEVDKNNFPKDEAENRIDTWRKRLKFMHRQQCYVHQDEREKTKTKRLQNKGWFNTWKRSTWSNFKTDRPLLCYQENRGNSGRENFSTFVNAITGTMIRIPTISHLLTWDHSSNQWAAVSFGIGAPVWKEDDL